MRCHRKTLARLCITVAIVSGTCVGGVYAADDILTHAQSIRDDMGAVEAVWCRMAAKLNKDRLPRRFSLTLNKAFGGTDVLIDIFDSPKTGRRALACAPLISGNVHLSRLDRFEGAGELDVRIHITLSFEGDPFARKMYSAGHLELPVMVHLRLKTANGRVSGSYSWKPEPIPADDPDDRPRKSPLKASSGKVSGAAVPVSDGVGRNSSFWKIHKDMEPSVLYPITIQLEKWADGLYRRIRAGELMRTHGCNFEEACSHVMLPMVVRPKLALARQAKQETKKSVSLDDMDMDDDLGLEDEDQPAPGGSAGKTSDPELKKAVEQVAQIARRLERMRALVERYEKTQSTPAVQTGFTEVDDFEFGPWYGTDSLDVVDDKANVLPAGIGGAGEQEWRSVCVWQAIGPFPLTDQRMTTPLLPDIVLTGEEVCAVQKGRIKNAKPGETEWRVRRAPDKRIFPCVTPPARFDLNPVATGLPRVMGGGRGGCPYSTCYMTTTIRSAEAVGLWAGIGINRTAQLWVNDTLVWNSPRNVVPGNLQESHGLIRLALRKGDNRLMLRMDADFSSPYTWLRLCLRGAPRSQEDVRRAASRVAAVRAGVAPEQAIGWRGDGTGVYPGTHPPVAWNRKKKQNVLWHTPTEYFGNATPVPVPDSNKVLVTQEPCWLICLDKDTGKELWRRAVTLLDLLPEAARKKGWALHEAWWKARRERDKIREGEGGGLKFAVPKWLRYSAYWAEGTGVWERGKEPAKDERDGASPELIALLDERDTLEADPDQEAVQDKLTSVLKKIEKIREAEAGDDPNSPVGIHARLQRAEGAYVKHLKEYSRVSGMGGGYWEDYCGWMYAKPVTDGQHVWVKTGSDVAACFDLDGNEKWAAVTGYDMRTGHTVYKVPALRKAGNTWTPACASERCVYHITGDTKFNGCGAKAPMDMVVMSRDRDPLFLANNAIDRTYGPGAIDGDRMYIRGYGGTTCVAYTGDETHKIGGQSYQWQALTQGCLKAKGFKGWELDSANFTDIHRMRRVADLGAAVGDRRGVVFLMTEFESHRDQVMRFDQQVAGARSWLGRVPVSHGDRIRFGKGFCQLLLEIPVADIPEEGLHVSPCFWDSNDVEKESADWVAAATGHAMNSPTNRTNRPS